MARKKARKVTKAQKKPLLSSFPYLKLIIAIGFILILISLVIRVHLATRLSFQGIYESISSKGDKVIPTIIAIPEINVARPVYGTEIVRGEWQIAKNGASYLKESSGLNQKYSAVIYDHNTSDKFQNLYLLKKGNKILVTGSDKKTYEYKVSSTMVVDPKDVDVLTNDSSRNLILYTCYGFADLKRIIVKAVPVE